MKLSHYIRKLQEIEKEFPDAKCIYQHKGEYFKVGNVPTEGEFKEDGLTWDEEFKTGTTAKINSVLIN